MMSLWLKLGLYGSQYYIRVVNGMSNFTLVQSFIFLFVGGF